MLMKFTSILCIGRIVSWHRHERRIFWYSDRVGIWNMLLQLFSFRQKCHRRQLAAFRVACRDGAGLLLNVSCWLWVRAQSKSCTLEVPVLTRNIPQISPSSAPAFLQREKWDAQGLPKPKVSHLNVSLLLQCSTRLVWIFWKCKRAKSLTSGAGISIWKTWLGPSKLSTGRYCFCFLMGRQALSFTKWNGHWAFAKEPPPELWQVYPESPALQTSANWSPNPQSLRSLCLHSGWLWCVPTCLLQMEEDDKLTFEVSRMNVCQEKKKTALR